MYNNYIITNCLQSVPVKEFDNWLIIGKDMDKSKVALFTVHGVVYRFVS